MGKVKGIIVIFKYKMENKILSDLNKHEKFLTYRNIPLIGTSKYELTHTSQSGIVFSPVFNFLKQFKLLIRYKLYKPPIGNKGKILFLVYTNSHINTSAPIIKKMKEKALVVKRDGFTNNVAEKLKQNNIGYNDIESYLTKGSLKNIRKAKESFKAKYKALLKTGEFDRRKLKYLFLIYFPEMIRYIEIVNNILSVEKPKLLAVMNEITTLGNIAVHIAKQKGIKTLCIQHGAIGNDPGSFVPVSADKVAVWGNSSKEILMKEGTTEERIVITGAPQFDNLKSINYNLTDEIINEIYLDKSKKYVLLTSQNLPNMKETVRHLCRALKSIPNVQLVIKTHPAEYSTKKYKNIMKEFGIKGVVTKKYLYPLMKECSVMITISSTTGLEALIMGKPLITINLSGKPDVMPYAESGAAIGIYKPENIMPALKSILEDQAVRKKLAKKAKMFIYEQCYKLDGKASERIVNLIKEMTKNN